MGYRKLSNNKYKIIIEHGYDIFGKRVRKTEKMEHKKKALSQDAI